MDKLVRKIEIPLARTVVERAGLYVVQMKDLDRISKVAADAYRDYPLHNWFSGGKTIPFLKNGGLKLIFHSGLGIIGRLLAYEDFAMLREPVQKTGG